MGLVHFVWKRLKSILLKDAIGPKVLAVYVYIKEEEETCAFIHACSFSGLENNIRHTYANL